MVSSTRDVDNAAYNPQADAATDDAAYDPENGTQPLGARGADDQPTSVNYEQEDRDAKRSEQTGQIPRSEMNDLLNSATDEEKNASGRTRGVKNDAYKQERAMDQALVDNDLADA